MKKNLKIITFLFLANAVFLILTQNSQGKDLEVQYLNIPGIGVSAPTTVEGTPVPDFIKYVYYFLIFVSGLLVFGVLVKAGVQYLTSAGNPQKLNDAKKQLISSFLGIILLLAAYLILININPDILKFQLPEIQNFTPSKIQQQPNQNSPTENDFLWRITEIGNSVKKIVDQENNLAKELEKAVSDCTCKKMHPLCACKSYMGGSCDAEKCYSQKPEEPCPKASQIKDIQQKIMDFRYELIYYKNRALGERENSALLEINYLDKKIISLNEEKSVENKNLSKAIEIEKPSIENRIKLLEDEIKNLNQKKEKYTELQKKLYQLALLIETVQTNNTSPSNPLLPDFNSSSLNNPPANQTEEKMAPELENLSKLPDQCLPNAENNEYCTGQGNCKEGCHNKKFCKPDPDECKGGSKAEGENPCPMKEIKEEIQKISQIGGKARSAADEVVNLAKEIVQLYQPK